MTRAGAAGVPAGADGRASAAARLAAGAALLAALGFVLLAARVPLPGDPLESRFLTPDSPDWLASGLALAGWDTSHNDRPPLLPGLYALLYLAGAERFVALLHPLVFLACAGAAWRLSRSTSSDPVRPPVAALLVLLLGKLAFQSYYVMADLLAAALSALAAAALAESRRSRAAVPAFAVLFTAAQATQNVLPFLLPPFALFVLAERRAFPRRRLATLAAVLVGTPVVLAALHLVLARAAGTAAYNLHVGYLGFLGTRGLRFYPLAALGLFGPLVPLAALGAARRSDLDRGSRILVAGSVVAGLAFFGLFYEWLTVRFLAYVAIPAAVLAAAPVAALLAGRRPWAGVAVLAAHGAYGALGHTDAYWPAVPLAPGTALVAEVEKLDPAWVQPWRLRTGTAPVVWLPRLLARPGEVPAGVIDHLAFDRGEVAELSGLGRRLRPVRGTTALLDPVHGVANRYVASAALRAPVVAWDAARPGVDRVVVRRGEPAPAGFRLRLEGRSFSVLEREPAPERPPGSR